MANRVSRLSNKSTLEKNLPGAMYCRGIRVSRKASCGRQRAEDKERLRERVLVDGKGDNSLSGGEWAAPLYIHTTVNARPCGSTTVHKADSVDTVLE